MRRSRLLVIGAGPVGLGMADALARAGIPYDHVEASSGIGGNWRHGVYATVHVVSSKRSTAFADYPMPADYPDFPSGAQMLAYLESYARDRGLSERIELDREVVEARPNPDDSWSVVFRDGERRIYKGVVVCNGHHWDRIMPQLPGRFPRQQLRRVDPGMGIGVIFPGSRCDPGYELNPLINRATPTTRRPNPRSRLRTGRWRDSVRPYRN